MLEKEKSDVRPWEMPDCSSIVVWSGSLEMHSLRGRRAYARQPLGGVYHISSKLLPCHLSRSRVDPSSTQTYPLSVSAAHLAVANILFPSLIRFNSTCVLFGRTSAGAPGPCSATWEERCTTGVELIPLPRRAHRPVRTNRSERCSVLHNALKFLLPILSCGDWPWGQDKRSLGPRIPPLLADPGA